VPPNKGMKQTSVEHIGRSQLIPGVRQTVVGSAMTRPAQRNDKALCRRVWPTWVFMLTLTVEHYACSFHAAPTLTGCQPHHVRVGMTQQEVLRAGLGEPQLWGVAKLSKKPDRAGVYSASVTAGTAHPMDAADVDWGFQAQDGTRRWTMVRFVGHRATSLTCATLVRQSEVR